MWQLRMHSNLRPPDAAPAVLLPFNYNSHTKVQVGQPIRCCLIAFFVDTLGYAVTLSFDHVTLTFDPLILKICSTLGVVWSKSVRNLNEIEQSSAELLTN